MRNLVLLSLMVMVFLPACETGRVNVYGCLEPCYDCEDPCTTCPHGECLPLPPLGWDGPVLLWTGPEDAAPECPERAPNTVYEGHDGLTYTPACAPCTCGPSACVFPGLVARGSDVCPPAGSETPYPPEEQWNGLCLSNGLVPAGSFGSIEYPPATEAPCEPQAGTVPLQADYRWGTLARACQTTEPPKACDPKTVCVPTSEPPPAGFSQCVFSKGDVPVCPFGYAERRVFYGGIDASATGCTECACSAPEGAVCQATLYAYDDENCSGGVVGATTVGMSEPLCSVVMSDLPLGSMSATWMTNQPGTCTPSGGDPFGEAQPAEPSTFCCQVKPL